MSACQRAVGLFEALRDCAAETINGMVRDDLGRWANAILVQAINTGCEPNEAEVAPALLR